MNRLATLTVPLIGTGEDALVVAAAVSAFLAVFALWYALFERDAVTARARMLAKRRAELVQGDGGRRHRMRRRKQLAALATLVVDHLRLAQSKGIDSVKERLAAAGLRSREAVVLYLFASVGLPVAAAAVTVPAALFAGHDVAFPSRLALGSAGVILGFLLPRQYLSRRIAARAKAFRRTLPDALDLLVICAEAGLSLDTALHRVADELARASPDLADELALTAVELTFLPDRRQALRNFARRVPLPAAQALVGTLIQTERYGTPLAPSLRVLANELREQRLIHAEEKAARLPAVLTVPLILFILPTLFVVLAGPAMIDIYDQLVNH